jgi:hypothetical protein
MKEAPGSSETSVLTRATRLNNPEDTILQTEDVCDQDIAENIWTEEGCRDGKVEKTV